MPKKTKINMGQKYWNEAKKIIPGGTMLFSKNPDLYLPKKWPAYFLKAKDIYIWDLEGKKYIDLATMGVGTNILGYANSEVNQEVIKTIKKSNISTLNSVEEIKLTKILLEISPETLQLGPIMVGPYILAPILTTEFLHIKTGPLIIAPSIISTSSSIIIGPSESLKMIFFLE